MAEKIRISTDEMEEKASTLEEKINRIVQDCSYIQTIIENMAFYWIGEAGTENQSRYQQVEEEITAFLEDFQKRPEELRTMAGIFDKASLSAESVVDSLPEPV